MTNQEYHITLPWPIGARFGHLTVQSKTNSNKFGCTQWNCICDCGTACVVTLYRMTKGRTKSCGCIKGKCNATHGLSKSKTYNSWMAMKERCTNSKSSQYKYYGARGVTVCQRWLGSFEAFLDDMGIRPDGMTIDRINLYGNYEPGNCRWVSNSEQAGNRRSTIWVELDGVKRCAWAWCQELGFNPFYVYRRIRLGKTPEEAFRCLLKERLP